MWYEVVVVAFVLISLFGLMFWGVVAEVKHMRAARQKELKQIELYEKLLEKLSEY